MKVLLVLSSAASVLMLLSTLLCGLWLRAYGSDLEGVAFHVNLAVATIAVTLVSLSLAVFKAIRR